MCLNKLVDNSFPMTFLLIYFNVSVILVWDMGDLSFANNNSVLDLLLM